ncbi:MAG TPA: hypothetical protein VI565_04705, partial [Burkholderiales bacterium]|nr:hypothetical protein [Burkholderiales bacterium]
RQTLEQLREESEKLRAQERTEAQETVAILTSAAGLLERDVATAREELSRIGEALSAEQEIRARVEREFRDLELSAEGVKRKNEALSADLSAERELHATARSELSAERELQATVRSELSVERETREATRRDLSAERDTHEATRRDLSAERQLHTTTRSALDASREEIREKVARIATVESELSESRSAMEAAVNANRLNVESAKRGFDEVSESLRVERSQREAAETELARVNASLAAELARAAETAERLRLAEETRADLSSRFAEAQATFEKALGEERAMRAAVESEVARHVAAIDENRVREERLSASLRDDRARFEQSLAEARTELSRARAATESEATRHLTTQTALAQTSALSDRLSSDLRACESKLSSESTTRIRVEASLAEATGRSRELESTVERLTNSLVAERFSRESAEKRASELESSVAREKTEKDRANAQTAFVTAEKNELAGSVARATSEVTRLTTAWQDEAAKARGAFERAALLQTDLQRERDRRTRHEAVLSRLREEIDRTTAER